MFSGLRDVEVGEDAEVALGNALRANIDETVLLVVITEQGENRNQCEEQRDLCGCARGWASRGA